MEQASSRGHEDSGDIEAIDMQLLEYAGALLSLWVKVSKLSAFQLRTEAVKTLVKHQAQL